MQRGLRQLTVPPALQAEMDYAYVAIEECINDYMFLKGLM